MTTTSQTSWESGLLEVENWQPVPHYPDYEVSDMGRVRCMVDRSGYKAPFLLKVGITKPGRPMVTLRNGAGQKLRRIDELVLEAFVGPRPAPDWGPVPTNGDRRDVRVDNLSWQPGIVKRNNRIGVRRKKKTVKRTEARLPKEIRHGHWLGVENVAVSIQPNNVIELTVGDTQDYHSIPVADLDDVIRILQAARTVIDG